MAFLRPPSQTWTPWAPAVVPAGVSRTATASWPVPCSQTPSLYPGLQPAGRRATCLPCLPCLSGALRGCGGGCGRGGQAVPPLPPVLPLLRPLPLLWPSPFPAQPRPGAASPQSRRCFSREHPGWARLGCLCSASWAWPARAASRAGRLVSGRVSRQERVGCWASASSASLCRPFLGTAGRAAWLASSLGPLAPLAEVATITVRAEGPAGPG